MSKNKMTSKTNIDKLQDKCTVMAFWNLIDLEFIEKNGSESFWSVNPNLFEISNNKNSIIIFLICELISVASIGVYQVRNYNSSGDDSKIIYKALNNYYLGTIKQFVYHYYVNRIRILLTKAKNNDLLELMRDLIFALYYTQEQVYSTNCTSFITSSKKHDKIDICQFENYLDDNNIYDFCNNREFFVPLFARKKDLTYMLTIEIFTYNNKFGSTNINWSEDSLAKIKQKISYILGVYYKNRHGLLHSPKVIDKQIDETNTNNIIKSGLLSFDLNNFKAFVTLTSRETIKNNMLFDNLSTIICKFKKLSKYFHFAGVPTGYISECVIKYKLKEFDKILGVDSIQLEFKKSKIENKNYVTVKSIYYAMEIL